MTNPAPLHPRSGTVKTASGPTTILAYRDCPYNCSGAELINMATAANYAGPYARIHPAKPIFSEASEVPFIWADKYGNFHMLVHLFLPDAGFGDGPNVGRHAYARSWSGPWTFNKDTVACNTTFDFDDSPAIGKYRRERPNIFFSEDGEMRPLFLSTGLQEMDSPSSYSLIPPIGAGQ
ncbi:uncharacterized protein N7482_009843 [Penicillium canariense]|uniref:Uncharacterized protein n=1 Tax=Penicillium canariense TaxID=189055 RepID=A0A9W9LGP3_9EURO|nr:uncharacterized protein N7482_009843 [Penicillium canariense]KAJ5153365.1 hypothetical protein N7482_009843 [Penicillium canariense]